MAKKAMGKPGMHKMPGGMMMKNSDMPMMGAKTAKRKGGKKK